MGSMGIGLGGALVLALDIYAIYSIMTSNNSAASKILWTLLVLILPLLGFILWLLFGPRSSVGTL